MGFAGLKNVGLASYICSYAVYQLRCTIAVAALINLTDKVVQMDGQQLGVQELQDSKRF